MKSSTPSLDQLKRAIVIAEQIQTLEAELARILGQAPSATTTAIASESTRGPGRKKGGKRTYNFSPETLAKRAAAKAQSEAKTSTKKSKKGKMSPEGRAAIVAAQKARWAKKREAAASAPADTAKVKKSKKA